MRNRSPLEYECVTDNLITIFGVQFVCRNVEEKKKNSCCVSVVEKSAVVTID